MKSCGLECTCNEAIRCDDLSIELSNGNEKDCSFEHNINTDVSATILGIKYSLTKTTRKFMVQFASGSLRSVTKAVIGNQYNEPTLCGASTSSVSGRLTEYVSREDIVPYFLSQQEGVFVYKKITETLSFASSCEKMVPFRTRGGNSYFNKFSVKGSPVVEGSEEFFVVRDGSEYKVGSTTFTYNPFPESTGSSTWGLLGNEIKSSVSSGYTRDPSLRMIMVFPNPPSEAIPLGDDELKDFGFYDYNAVSSEDPGALAGTISKLAREDGGKDMYYPEWCRKMTPDPFWRSAADRRVELRWPGAGAPREKLTNNNINYLPEPTSYALPFGSFATNHEKEYVDSALFLKRDGSYITYNRSSPEGILKNIMAAVPYSSNFVLYPVVPLCG